MTQRPEIRNHQRELYYFRLRLTVAASVVLLLFAILLARAFWLQVLQYEHYHTLAEENRISIVPIVPNRGLILDRNGAVLAHNYSAYTLEITPTRVEGGLEKTIDALAELIEITPKDRKRFRKLLEESRNFETLPIRTRLNDVEIARFAANRYRFPGVEIRARLFRHYPQGEITASPMRISSVWRRRSWLPTTAVRTTSARRAWNKATSRSCMARPASSGWKPTPAAAPCAPCRAPRRFPATISPCTWIWSCNGWRNRPSAASAAPWWPSIPAPAAT